jgi:hypothetical protein
LKTDLRALVNVHFTLGKKKIYQCIKMRELLKIETPLLDDLEYVSEYVKVDHWKRIRINSFSDVILQVNHEWIHSLDGTIDQPMKNTSRTPSHMWKSELHSVIFNYVRVRCINQSGKKNEKLVIILSGCGLTGYEEKESIPEKIEEKIEEKEEEKEEKKHRGFFRKKQERPLSCGNDPRLPGFISKSSILCGSKMGKIQCLAPGNIGEILQMTELGPTWTLLYPPHKLSEESKKKMRENKEVNWHI